MSRDSIYWSVNPTTPLEIETNWRIIGFTESRLRTEETVYAYLTGRGQTKDGWQRGFTDETLAEFNIGYYPPNAKIRGITQMSENGNEYEPLAGRITIPVLDVWDTPISMMGRKMPGASSRMKMLPIPYPKSSHVWNLNKAKQAILEKGFVIGVEGQFDAMTLWQEGIHNVVCFQGTGASFRQLCLIRRYTDAILYVTDNDDGGSKSVDLLNREVAKLQRYGCNFLVDYVQPPAPYKDPNDVRVQASNSVSRDFFDMLRETVLS